ncbi:MAG: DUF1887 family CARF protein [Campylobacterales bacterium]
MVLVSLLGDFDSSILPLFFEHKEKLSLHVLVHDKTTRDQKEARRLEKGLKALKHKYRIACNLETIEIDEDHFKVILALGERLLTLAPPEELFLNVSDGLANVGIILSKAVLERGANLLIYDRYDNQVNHLTLGGMKRMLLSKSMGVEDHLIAKGYDLVDYKDPDALERRRPYVMEITRNFRQFQKFRKLVMREKKPDDNRFDSIIHSLWQLGVATRKGRALDTNYILGELFEEQIYHLVREMGFDDVLCGAKVHFETIDDTAVQNEFDVMMIKNNHLYIIECKFRDRVDGEYLIYKYDALLDRLDRDGKVMIVNVASTEAKDALRRGKRIHHNFEKGTLYRAQLNNILIYYEPTLDVPKLRQMMRRFFEA